LAIGIPAGFLSDVSHLRDKTVKVGVIGRAAAIFRVDEILVYLDKRKFEGDGEFICQVLRFMDTPQYLRKRLFGISSSLKYAGLLPPLRTPPHSVESRLEFAGRDRFREGVVVKSGRRGSLVDIGLEKLFPVSKRFPVGSRLVFRVVRRRGRVRVKPVSRGEVDVYWGFEVKFTGRGLRRSILDFGADLVIATSRYGDLIQNVWGELSERLVSSKRTLILFGSPDEGLFDMARREGFNLRDYCDFIVNMAPFQGTKTIRTEEAVLISLSIINLLSFLHHSNGGVV